MRARSLFSSVRRVVVRVIFALLLAGALGSTQADIQEPIQTHNAGQRLQSRGQRRDSAPANATSRQVQVHQGETIDILLASRGQAGKTVEFTIRTPPTHGTLVGLHQLTRNTASITYTHHAEDGPGSDGFTYAVQAVGSAMSAPVPVFVEVLDQPPSVVTTPEELDFGAVKAGEATRATLTVENRGGGTAVGRVEPPSPWTVEGDAQYRLARGETQAFQLVFQPSYGRSYIETIHLRGDAGPGVRLVGAGIGPRDPSGDVARIDPARAVAETIARDNALARAAENSAQPPPAAGGPASSSNRPVATPSSFDREAAMANAIANASSSPALSHGEEFTGTAADGTLNLPPGGVDSVVVNEAAVTRVEVRGVGTTTLDLAWNAPRPTPKSYRVELRYLTLDADDKLRIDWRPYAKVDVRVGTAGVTAQINALPPSTRQNLRVVAVDDAGRLAPPSATLVITTRAVATWWHVTPLKVLVFLLLVCLGLMLYRKWEEQQILRGIDESRAARRDADLSFRS